MDEIWVRNYKNSEKIRNRRRRILINRIMNQHKVDLLEKKYEEIIKEWILIKNTTGKKSNVNYNEKSCEGSKTSNETFGIILLQ